MDSDTDTNTDTDIPDLTGAEVFVEASARPIAGGRWYIIPSPDGDADNDRVVYRRPNGELQPKSVIAARTLRSSPTWRPLAPETTAGG